MARRTWTPDGANDEQRAALAEFEAASSGLRDAETRLSKAIEKMRRAKIPGRYIATRIKSGRATLYRRFPLGEDSE